MKLVTRLKFILFISTFFLILSILPYTGVYLNLAGRLLLLSILAWHASAKLTRYVLGHFVSPVNPESKWIVVSNCDTDYGIEIVKSLHSHFSFKVIAGFRDPQSIYAEKLKELNFPGVRIIRLKCEDSEMLATSLHEINEAMKAQGDELWALVNLMSSVSIGKVEWSTVKEQYKDIMDANVISAVALSRALLPLLRKSKGRIVNVTDLPSKVHLPYHASWNMSSSSLSFLTDCLRKEIFFFGVKVVSIEPDYYCTPLSREHHLMPALNKSWNSTDDDKKCTDDWIKVKNVITTSHECNSEFICKKISHSVGDALVAPSQCLEYKYVISCTLNHSFLWLINVIVPQEIQEVALSAYRNVIGLSQRP